MNFQLLFFFLSNWFHWVNSCHKTFSTRRHCFAFWLHRYREDQLTVAISKHMPSQREVIEPGERGRELTAGPAGFLITPSSPCMYMLSLCFLLTVGPSYPLSLLSASLATGYWLCVCCQLGWWAARPGGNRGSWQEHQLKAPRGAAPDSSHNTTVPPCNSDGTRGHSGVPRDLVSKKVVLLSGSSLWVCGRNGQGGPPGLLGTGSSNSLRRTF